MKNIKNKKLYLKKLRRKVSSMLLGKVYYDEVERRKRELFKNE